MAERGIRDWLREKGFDPEGDLCTDIQCKTHPWVTRTAMSTAAEDGDLDVYRYLLEHGAASAIRTRGGTLAGHR